MLKLIIHYGSVIGQKSNLSICPSSDNGFYLLSFKNLNRPVLMSTQHNRYCFLLYQFNIAISRQTVLSEHCMLHKIPILEFHSWKKKKITLRSVPIFKRLELFKSFLIMGLENWTGHTSEFFLQAPRKLKPANMHQTDWCRKWCSLQMDRWTITFCKWKWKFQIEDNGGSWLR